MSSNAVAVRSFRLWKLKEDLEKQVKQLDEVAVRSFRLWKLKDVELAQELLQRDVAVRSFRLWKLKAATIRARSLAVATLQFVRSDCGN